MWDLFVYIWLINFFVGFLQVDIETKDNGVSVQVNTEKKQEDPKELKTDW